MGRRRRRGRPVTGVLLVDKPAGITSFKTVERVRRALDAQRAGHTGTLDPMATGLLPICLGQTTRLAQFISDADKAYRATLRLGITTDSLDAEGTILSEDPAERVAEVGPSHIAEAMEAFRGPIEQRPPAFSAIKVDGERLYAKARRGEAVEAPMRKVTIHHLELIESAPPLFTFDVLCSKGTYVRSLGADLAASVGLGGHLVALRRTQVASLDVADAMTLEAIENAPDEALAHRISPARAVGHMPVVKPGPELVRHLRHGRRRPIPDAPTGVCVALDAQDRLVAIIDVPEAGPVEIIRGFPLPPPDGASPQDA